MALENKATLPMDSQDKPLYDSTWSPLKCERLVTFTGGTANTWGDYDGTKDGSSLFTVTGVVKMRMIGIVETSIVGAGTIEAGIVGATAVLIAQVADAEDLDVGEIWHDATVDAKVELTSVATEKIITVDPNLTIGTANITAGAVRFLVSSYPMSEGAMVIPTTD